MTYFHAVFVDETGREFGAGIKANTYEEAAERLRENYPESQLVQLESPEDVERREAAIYRAVYAEYDDFHEGEEW